MDDLPDPKWRPPEGWTLDTLHLHVITIMNEREKRLDERFLSQEKAGVRLAEELAGYKSQSNEWRGALNDNTVKLLLRTEYDVAHRTLVERVEQVSKSVSAVNDRLIPIESRSGYASITLILSSLGAVLGTIALIHTLALH
jgi:hypothetical protein